MSVDQWIIIGNIVLIVLNAIMAIVQYLLHQQAIDILNKLE